MSYILTYVEVTLAPSDIWSILELSIDEIHMEEWNHSLAWTKPSYKSNNDIVNWLACKQLHLNHVVLKQPKEE